IVRTAIDRGVNFMDNSWDYNDGESERRMGKALLDGYRERAFLMTKIDGRTKQEAAQQLDESLRRLRVNSSCSITRSFATKTRIESSTKREPTLRCWRRAHRGSCAT
ncbi:MAG TPA: aldo/keto reductase, partial [Pyrinomonadaceae bacterium]|nr:aldo/keto reductase [Pyrinomonadaceae bacterium]